MGRRFALQDYGLPVVILTEEQVLEFYWPWWSGEMLRVGGRSPRITPQNCVDDYRIAQLAWEVPEDWEPPVREGDDDDDEEGTDPSR